MGVRGGVCVSVTGSRWDEEGQREMLRNWGGGGGEIERTSELMNCLRFMQ